VKHHQGGGSASERITGPWTSRERKGGVLRWKKKGKKKKKKVKQPRGGQCRKSVKKEEGEFLLAKGGQALARRGEKGDKPYRERGAVFSNLEGGEGGDNNLFLGKEVHDFQPCEERAGENQGKKRKKDFPLNFIGKGLAHLCARRN